MDEDSEEDTENKSSDQDDENKGVLVMDNNKVTIMTVLSTKILVLPPKYEIIMVPSNRSCIFTILRCKYWTFLYCSF